MKIQYNLSNDVICRSTESAVDRLIEVNGKIDRKAIMSFLNIKKNAFNGRAKHILNSNFQEAVREFDLPELEPEDMEDVIFE